MYLYLKVDGSLEEAAKKVGGSALRGWKSELREGLNLGGGDYFKFTDGRFDVLLVCNDADHAEVFVEERMDFPYYCYVREGNDPLLERMQDALSSIGVVCALYEDA